MKTDYTDKINKHIKRAVKTATVHNKQVGWNGATDKNQIYVTFW